MWHSFIDRAMPSVACSSTSFGSAGPALLVANHGGTLPLDALVLELGSSRNAIYKVLFDARRKLRSVLVANGYLRDDSAGNS